MSWTAEIERNRHRRIHRRWWVTAVFAALAAAVIVPVMIGRAHRAHAADGGGRLFRIGLPDGSERSLFVPRRRKGHKPVEWRIW